MNSASASAPELLNTLHSHNQAYDLVSLPAARLNEDVSAALKWSRTFSLSQPEFSCDRREGQEVGRLREGGREIERERLID